MNQPQRILVAISQHGFGHLTQVAPLVNALRRYWPAARLRVYSGHSAARVASRIQGAFEHLAASPDPGMEMRGALDVDAAASRRAYAAWHTDWPRRMEAEMQRVEGADLVIGDVPYAVLAAARRSGIPSVGVCSLNWADIFAHYCGGRPETDAWVGQMRAAYAAADLFLQPAPSMPMAWLPNREPIGPLVQSGRRRRDELGRRLGALDGAPLVLVNLGGVPMALGFADWPAPQGMHYLVPGGGAALPPGFSDLSRLDWGFSDILASVDCLVTKPGYGLFSEAACLGLPVVYVRRGDWPEEPYLTAWLHQYGRALALPRAALEGGELEAAVQTVLNRPAKPAVEAGGAEAGLRLIQALFR